MPTTDTTDTDERRVANRYLLTRRIGVGGMGVVWEALDELLARRVAIKAVELPATVVGTERAKFAARVLREARAAARLSHPGAVTLYDVIRERDVTYIVMELVEARSLAALVEQDGPVTPERAARIGLQILTALQVAHGHGIVHRDVKPGNVLVLPDGRTKLTDFGIATLRGDPELTTTGTVMGSPGYMSPEQASGEGSGPAADLYGLGATLYYAVEGRAPFDKTTAIPTIAAVVNEPPRPMERAGALAPVIERLLAKDPDERPAGPEAQRLLQRVAAPAATAPAATVPAAATTVPQRPVEPAGDVTPTEMEPPTRNPEPATAPAAAPARVPAGVPGRPGGRGLRPLAAVGALLLALAVGVAAVVATRSGDDRQGQTGAASRTTAGGAAGGGSRGGSTTSTATTRQPTTTKKQAPTTAAPGQGAPAVPEGWRTFRAPSGVYRLAYPGDWRVRQGSGRIVDFLSPGGGTYLRVDWTDKPQDPVANWTTYERQFAASHSGYQRIRLSPGTFQGMRAALWEYRYRSGGTTLHAVNHTFVTRDGRFAYAFNFQTREQDWASSADLLAQLQRQFRATVGGGS